ncbi:transcriptional antiterminator, partial [Acinetobacter baumannii]
NIKNSGGADKMLNFFVTLVNVISLPVIMVGTPKARYIFNDLRGNRRAAGFGSVLWEPIKNEPNLELNNRIFKSEWNAFTDALW